MEAAVLGLIMQALDKPVVQQTQAVAVAQAVAD